MSKEECCYCEINKQCEVVQHIIIDIPLNELDVRCVPEQWTGESMYRIIKYIKEN